MLPFILPSPGLVWARFLAGFGERQPGAASVRDPAGGAGRHDVGGQRGHSVRVTCWRNRQAPSSAWFSPYVVASQSVPVVAIAPLLIIWFGPGMLSKVLICALIVFFPVLVNTIVGLRSVPEELQDLMRSLQANRWQMVTYLEVPSALPVFLGGLRIGATLSVIGAVVGEFVGGPRPGVFDF